MAGLYIRDNANSDATTTVAELRKLVADFVAERDWSQFHSPKNVSMALAIEAAELMEHFQWLTTEASRELADDPEKLAEVGEELADVIGYSFALANELGIDVSSAIRAKMVKNAQKYPAEKYRGRYETREDDRSSIRVNQPLAIVGASTRAAAASAVRAGFQPLAADLFADADLRAHCHGHANLALSRRLSRLAAGRRAAGLDVHRRARKSSRAGRSNGVDRAAVGQPGRRARARPLAVGIGATCCATPACCFRKFARSADGLPRDGSWLAKTYQRRERQRRASVGARETRRRGARRRSETRRISTSVDASTSGESTARRVPPSLSPPMATRKLLGVTRQLIGEAWLGAHGFQYAGSIGPWPITEAARDDARAASAMCWPSNSSLSACSASISFSMASEFGRSK